MDLMTLILRMLTDGSLARIARNPLAQFGPDRRPYLGSQLLPEREVQENGYTEDGIRYKTVIANDGTRYSPVQVKDSGAMAGSFTVILGNQDIGRNFSGRDYDAFLELLRRSTGARPNQQAVLQLTNWLDVVINRALIELSEKQRWELLVNATTIRQGDNGFRETVNISNPAGHRVAAADLWSDPTYDPYEDITAMVQKLSDKGYTCNRIITSRRVMNLLARNPLMASKMLNRVVVVGGALNTGGQTRVTQADINQLFNADGIPSPELYELTYNTMTDQVRFLADDVMVFISTTGRDENIIVSTGFEVIPDTLGYTAIGRAVGQSAPGRVVKMFPKEDKPPRIEAQGWQTSFPVITEPEAIGVITAIA
jgi:hypothetical protein